MNDWRATWRATWAEILDALREAFSWDNWVAIPALLLVLASPMVAVPLILIWLMLS